MTTNQITTGAALAFAAFALWFISRQTGSPVVAISPQPAQQQRDAGLAGWLGGWQAQEAAVADVVRNSYIGERIRAWERSMNNE